MIDRFRILAALLLAVWRSSRLLAVCTFGLLALGALSAPLAALGVGALTDAAIQGHVTRATWLGVGVGALVLAQLTMDHWSHFLYFRLGAYHQIALSEELMGLSNASTGLTHHETPEYADRIELVRRDYWGIVAAAQYSITAAALLVQMVLTGILLARLDPWLLLLPLFAIPPLIGGRRANTTVDRLMLADAEKVRQIGHIVDLSTLVSAAREIRVFGLADELRRRQRTLRAEVDAHMFRAQLVASLWTVGTQLLSSAAYLGAIYLVVREAAAGRRTVGDVVLTIVLAAQVNGQLSGALDIVFTLQRALLATERMRWLRTLVRTLEPTVDPAARVPDRLRRGIVFEGVSFRYGDAAEPALQGVSLDLAPGTTLAIVGDNGAGKTTLVKLLSRMYEPTEGRILVDGTDLARLDPVAWRERMAAAFQDYHRFELLARESVGIGDLPEIEDAESVRAALGRAHATDVVDGLPDGLETQLGKSYADGAELSGGQWQKLALGRAMMRETPLLLVLDEPTAALDAHAEHALFERYAASARAVGTATGAITVFVSHRFSTVRMADHIAVLAGGRLVEQGSHDELIRLNGLYAELFELQAAAYR